MSQTKTLSIKRSISIKIAQIAGLIAVASLAPLAMHQAITGTIVNATLFISTILLGYKAGIFVGITPSLIAFSLGLLPAPLAPMIPFIIISNILLVLTFSGLKNTNFWIKIATASTIKFIFLFATSSIVIKFWIAGEIGSKIAIMMSWPQLLTALAGGVLAYSSLKLIKKI